MSEMQSDERRSKGLLGEGNTLESQEQKEIKCNFCSATSKDGPVAVLHSFRSIFPVNICIGCLRSTLDKIVVT